MNISRILKISAFSITMLSNLHANAWWDQTHQLIGLMASKNISEKTHDAAIKLLKYPISYPGSLTLSQNTSDFDTAASWPDALKLYSDQSNADHKKCHFTDFKSDSSKVGKDVSYADAQKSLQASLKDEPINSVSCLKSAIKTLSNAGESDVNRAVALRFVVHIIGDMGQPLHNISLIRHGKEDFGGTRADFDGLASITATNGSTKIQKNLHALWDASVGVFFQFPFEFEDAKMGKFSDEDRNFNIILSKKLEDSKYTKTIYSDTSSSNDSIEDWVIEGHQIALQYVYTDTDKQWGIYSLQREDLIKKQVLKSSMRLAQILNAVFDKENTSPGYDRIVSNIKADSKIEPFKIQ